MILPMTTVNRYRDRQEAGQKLAKLLHGRAGWRDNLILALPRGGLPVGVEIARDLRAPLDIFLVRKLGVPEQPEYAMGAIATGGIRLLDEELIERERITREVVDELTKREMAELLRRELLYRQNRPPLALGGKHVVLVDDGVATGYTMRVAIAALERLGPADITVAVPVGAPETCEIIDNLVDELICPMRPDPFNAVGLWYDHFHQTSDEEVRAALADVERWAESGK